MKFTSSLKNAIVKLASIIIAVNQMFKLAVFTIQHLNPN